MTIDDVNNIITQGIQVIIMASIPATGVGLIVGLIIAVFQAVTQIQEQTLTFVPKMVAVFLIVALTFSWMSNMVLDLATSLWTTIPIYSR